MDDGNDYLEDNYDFDAESSERDITNINYHLEEGSGDIVLDDIVEMKNSFSGFYKPLSDCKRYFTQALTIDHHFYFKMNLSFSSHLIS